jgi:phosphate transport system protein
MREHYEEKFENILQKLIFLGSSCKEQLDDAVKAFFEKNGSILERVTEKEEMINKMQVDIENDIISAIATEAPVAGDLRNLIAFLKIATSLERIADYALHLAELAKDEASENPAELENFIREIAEIEKEMLIESIAAMKLGNAGMALEIAKRDGDVDLIYNNYIGSVYQTVCRGDVRELGRFILIGRYMERLGDHIKNICESIIYSEKAEHIEL